MLFSNPPAKNSMEIKIESRQLCDVAVVIPQVFQDARGFFMETFRDDQFRKLGLPSDFVQDSHSRSKKGVTEGVAPVRFVSNLLENKSKFEDWDNPSYYNILDFRRREAAAHTANERIARVG
jgi:dTDP-4-dehydrorhamnose 3,5-epimerase